MIFIALSFQVLMLFSLRNVYPVVSFLAKRGACFD